MDEYLTVGVHNEFARRIEDENNRQNHRIQTLEDSVRTMGSIATSVERLATNMESMLKEQEKQGERLETLEGRDGEKWRSVASYVLLAVVGIIIGIVSAHVGI